MNRSPLGGRYERPSIPHEKGRICADVSWHGAGVVRGFIGKTRLKSRAEFWKIPGCLSPNRADFWWDGETGLQIGCGALVPRRGSCGTPPRLGQRCRMRVMRESVTIGRVAKAAGVSISTIRYYERRGLLLPDERSARSRYRFY